MDTWLDFIARMVTALAWPITTVVIVFALRKSITALVPKIEEFNLGPLRMKIKQEIAEAKELAEEVNEQLKGENTLTNQNDEMTVTELSKQWQLANLSPEAAILAQWAEVEFLLKQLAVQNDFNPRSPLSRILEQLAKAGIVDRQSAKLFKALRGVRNEVAHATTERIGLDTHFALDYLSSADTLRQSLEEALGQSK